MDGDGIYLYKGGTEGAVNTGNEPYSEYYACQIADKMGIGCVQYDLENWKGILASKCRLFTDIDTSFVPIGRILRISYEDVCKEVMGAKQKAQLRRMVDFKFTRHPSLNLPEQRLTAIEKQLVERTRELLSIPVQRSTKRKNEPEG